MPNWIPGSEQARLRASLRQPPKLPVHISCRQLSRRLSDARMREKELNRVVEQARTRRRANLGSTILLTNRVSNLHGPPTSSAFLSAQEIRMEVMRRFDRYHSLSVFPLEDVSVQAVHSGVVVHTFSLYAS